MLKKMLNRCWVYFQTCPRGGDSYHDWYGDRGSCYSALWTRDDRQPQHQLPQVHVAHSYIHMQQLTYCVTTFYYLPDENVALFTYFTEMEMLPFKCLVS